MSSLARHATPRSPSSPARRRWVLRAQGAAIALVGLVAAGGVLPHLAGAGTTSPLGSPPSTATDPDPAAVEIGAQFTVGAATNATGVRFYKGIDNDGSHTGRLWNSSGLVLATATFQSESATGWQQALFDTPVPLTAGTTYTVSYSAPNGHYSVTTGAFSDGNVLTSGPATQTRGVYAYGEDATFPQSTWNDANYYVDVTTSDTGAPPTMPPTPPDDNSGTWPNSPPDAGTPAGVDLTAADGSTVTEDGTVLSGLSIHGTVTVAADNVVIMNSRIEGSGDYGVLVRPGGSVKILRTTITGFDNGVGGDDYVANYVEVTGLGADGFKLGSRVVIANSWCHDMTPGPGAHADCGQLQSGETQVVLRHNWFDVGDDGGNSALFIAPSLGPSSPGPVTISNNVLGGGNYSLFCVAGDNGLYVIGGISVVGNHFLRNAQYGPAAVNVPLIWLTNTWLDTGLPLLL